MGLEINILGTILTFRAWYPHKWSNSPTFIFLNTAVTHFGVFPSLSSYISPKTGEAWGIAILQAENPDIQVVSMYPGVLEADMYEESGLSLSHDDMNFPPGFA